jgi:hypothetical protein
VPSLGHVEPPHVVGVQCEFLFRLRTETRSVLEDERKSRGSRVEMPRAPEAPCLALPCLALPCLDKKAKQSVDRPRLVTDSLICL